MNKYTEKELLENFSNNVNFLLEKEKRSKQSFLNELGFSLSSFVNWTKQNSLPSADVVLQIASYFHVSPYDLVYKNIRELQMLLAILHHQAGDTEGERFVNRIDCLLTTRNETRKKLCDEVGISLQAISNWKSQNSVPNCKVGIKIAQYFSVPIEWLINGTGYENKIEPYEDNLDSIMGDLKNIILKIKKIKTGK